MSNLAKKQKQSYSAIDIEVLEGLDPVRKRPGMYIGGTEDSNGLHHLFKEILDNSIDEAMNGHARNIRIVLHKDGQSITVSDDGRGIPVDMHPKLKKPALEIILTTLHSGGKFSDNNYMSAGGLHGVGSSVVNALSENLDALISRDGYEWRQSFSRGKPTSKLIKGKSTKDTGTSIFFRPDPEIFKYVDFSSSRIEGIIEEKAFLNKGVILYFSDEAKGTEKKFVFEEGIQAYLNKLLKAAELTPVADEIFVLSKQDGIKVDVAFAWTESPKEKILSFVNGIGTGQGGSHVDGFKNGLSKAIRNYLSVHDLIPKGVKLTGDDLREGLICVLSVNVPGREVSLQFQGQTKDKLNNPEVMGPVEVVLKGVENILNSKPNVAALITERIMLAAKARAASRAAAENVSRKVGASRRLNLPGKLADCSISNPEKAEIFIVEGDSAGGSAKQGRDRNTQAVLPLRGKILNSISAGTMKISENRELSDLVSALGCGVGDSIKLDKLRYHKVVILTDADSDGMHIAALLMAFFFRFMKPLVDNGHIFIGLSPLYRIKIGSGGDEQIRWVYTDEEKEAAVKELARRKLHITRFKGLGEMNPKSLWETTLNPRNRKLLRVGVGDISSTTQVLEELFGKDPSVRYRLIQENAHTLDLDL